MKTSEVNIRDPYLLPYQGKYYLYGTRSATCWGPADGFDCYVSNDLENWDGPFEIFHRPENFFADREYWAPECILHEGAFYLITTFGAGDRKKGVYVLRADSPLGPFIPYSDRLTPENWTCIDGTVYFEGNIPWLIFSHSFEDSPNGDMYAMQLSADLKTAAGKPVKLFSAAEAEWAKPAAFAKENSGISGGAYLSDGPCIVKVNDEKLYMTWSSWGTNGYAVGVAISDSGQVQGPWRQTTPPIFPENGGHGMVFRDYQGSLRFVLHFPNDLYKERPKFMKFLLDQETLKLED